MHTPALPGEIIKSLVLEPLGITITEAADTFSESWLLQQVQYDLWHAEQKRKDMDVEKLKAA